MLIKAKYLKESQNFTFMVFQIHIYFVQHALNKATNKYDFVKHIHVNKHYYFPNLMDNVSPRNEFANVYHFSLFRAVYFTDLK